MARPDPVLFQGSFHDGIVRDTARHLAPASAIYNATDLLLEKPGVAYKRGGWSRHSAAIGAVSTVGWVGTIHVPTRVVAITDAGTAYDVTSESSPQAASIGAVGFVPAENSPVYDGKLVLCHPDSGAAPKTVYDSAGMTIGNLFGGSMPHARCSTIHNGVVVVARDDTYLRRVWFLPDPALEPGVLVDESSVDVSNEVTGIASVSGVLLVFSPKSVERVIGGVPYGRTGANMEVQPVANAGCLDARSIVVMNEGVVFAGEEGVWLTNGAAPLSLTAAGGIQSYWRSLFPASTIRKLSAGPLGRDFYKIDVLSTSNVLIDTLLCHLPSRRWTRLTNCATRCMSAGRTEQESFELYGAASDEGYVNKYRGILEPVWANRADGDTTNVLPFMELMLGDAGPLRKFGKGRLNYRLTADTGSPTLDVSKAVGLYPGSFSTPVSLAAAASTRAPFDVLNDNQQAVTIRVQQTGASAATEIYGVDVDAAPYEATVTGGY